MAILRDQEDSQQKSQQGNADLGTPVGGSRVSSFSSGTQAPAQSSGRFTNLKKYVDANKGSGSQLGERITGGLEKETAKATDTSQADRIAKNVQAEKDRLAQGDVFNQRIKNDEARAIASDTEQKSQFQSLLNKQNNLSNLTTQQQQAEMQQLAAMQGIQGKVGNLGSESGRFQLLQNTIKNPNYTTGQQRLDQLMLQADNPSSLVSAQRNLGQQIKGAAGTLNDMYRANEAGIAQAGTEADRVAKLLSGTLTSTTGDLVQKQQDLAQKLNTQNTEQNAALERILSGQALAGDSEKVSEILGQAGLNTGMTTYNTLTGDKWKNYYQQGATDLTGQKVISADDFGRYEALRGLAGQGLSDFTQAGGGFSNTGLSGNLKGDIEQQLADFVSGLQGKKYSSTVKSPGLAPLLEVGTNAEALYSNIGGAETANLNNLINLFTATAGGKDQSPLQYTTAGRSAAQVALDKYLADVKNAGFRNTLGGVAPSTTPAATTAPTGFVPTGSKTYVKDEI